MYRKVLLILCILFLIGCSKTYLNTNELIEVVRKKIPVANAEEIEIQYAGSCGIDNTSLLWYISGNEYQSHTYFPIECDLVGQVEYKYIRSYKPIDRTQDIAVLQWKDGYSFCINNPKCTTIRITDDTSSKDITIEKDSYPYVYYHQTSVNEYLFLDETGNILP